MRKNPQEIPSSWYANIITGIEEIQLNVRFGGRLFWKSDGPQMQILKDSDNLLTAGKKSMAGMQG